MTPDPLIILGVFSFVLLVACGVLMLHAAGLRRERDAFEKKADDMLLELGNLARRFTEANAAASRAAYIADGVRSLVAQADGNAPQA
jgi:hypothetical protein